MLFGPSSRRTIRGLGLGGVLLAGCNQVLGNSPPDTTGSGGTTSGSGGTSPGGTGGTASGGATSGGATSSGGAGSGGLIGSGGAAVVECSPACNGDQGCVGGTCLPILPECMGQSVGTAVCSADATSSFVCGQGLAVKESEQPCGAYCSGSACIDPPSCVGLERDCGPDKNAGCCTSPLVTGGVFARGNAPDFPATVGDFRFDEFEVTVGRFRQFVAAMVDGWYPTAGSGKHSHLRGGLGLLGTDGEGEPGWDVSWNVGDDTYGLYSGSGAASEWTLALQCSSKGYHTWTPGADLNERLPINCVNWYQAAAFCIWDGGFLSSEAEWEYAAAGGTAQRPYPWGSPEPDDAHAVHWCLGDGSVKDVCSFADILPVGSRPDGNGVFGQSDLAGSMYEWNLDWLVSPYAIADCDNCTQTVPDSEYVARSNRGGSWLSMAEDLPNNIRNGPDPATLSEYYGIRCARVP